MYIMSAGQIRQAEQKIISEQGDNGLELMRRAGAAFADAVAANSTVDGKRIVVLCGNGNNGGDGYAAAALLAGRGAEVFVYEPLGEPRSDTAAYFRNSAAVLVRFCSFPELPEIIASADVIVDAIFGIGFHGTLDKELTNIVSICNDSCAAKFAVDVPSGVCADSGTVDGVCFDADVTVTFSAFKPCFALLPAARHCGKVTLADIGISESVLRGAGVTAEVIDSDFIRAALPGRDRFANKFDFGRVFMFCGSYGMAGAAILAAKAAYRAGAGIVDVSLPSSIYPIVSSCVPEAVFYPYDCLDGKVSDGFAERLQKADAALIGCGLGKGKEIRETVRQTLKSINIPTVLDADGINAVSSGIDILEQVSAPLILTPHTGEMARLTGLSSEEIEADRINVAVRFAGALSSVIVLKGAETVVASPDGRVCVNMTAGNPGMATAGSGDILAGVISALLAGGVEPYKAAASAVMLHAMAGDAAAERYSATSMTAGDMTNELAHLFAQYERMD